MQVMPGVSLRVRWDATLVSIIMITVGQHTYMYDIHDIHWSVVDVANGHWSVVDVASFYYISPKAFNSLFLVLHISSPFRLKGDEMCSTRKIVGSFSG